MALAVSRAPSSVLAITKNNAGLHALIASKSFSDVRSTLELRSPPALQWPFLESDTYSFLIDICQKYWHFDLLASYGPGRRCVVHHPPLGTAVWTIGFKKMVIGEPEKKYLKKYLLSAYWIVLELNFQWHIFSHFTDFLLEISKIYVKRDVIAIVLL